MIELNDYPKAKELYVKWCNKMYQFIFKDKELKGKEAERFAELTLQSNHRSLLDFFDEQDIVISIINHIPGHFLFVVNQEGEEGNFGSRREAEKEAFEYAFSMLENRLSFQKEETI